MDIISLTFVTRHGPYNPGQIAGFAPRAAQLLLDAGVAVHTPPAPLPVDPASFPNRRTAGLKGMVRKGS